MMRQRRLQIVPVLPHSALSDTVPELTRYRDDGCVVHPACLTCPLPRCRYDEPFDPLAAQRDQRNAAIVRAAREERLTVTDLTLRFGVSRRTVHRILQQQRLAANA